MNGLKRVATEFRDELQLARLVVTPLVLAAPAVLVWHLLYVRGWHSTHEADEPIVNAILPLIGSAYVFLAGFLFYRETADLREMKQAVRCKDQPGSRERFLSIAEDCTPMPIKYVLFSAALLVECWTISLHYEWYWTGFASVGSVGYVLSLIWEVIADLDDPIHGVWVIKGVPEEWLEDAHIKLRLSDRLFEALFGREGRG
jgi:hypothetical protein